MAGSVAHEADAQRFLRLVNSLDHSIVWEFDDTTSAYTFVSDHSQLVLGYDADEWLADPHRFEKCILPEDLNAFEAVLGKLRGGEANDLRLEHRCVTADGGCCGCTLACTVPTKTAASCFAASPST